MYKLSDETKNNINDTFQRNLGISYEEFEKLNFLEQQKLINEYHSKNSKKQSNNVNVMIGEGEHSTFVKVQKEERVLIGEGEHSCFVMAGVTPEKEMLELDNKTDNILYSKPVNFVKKLKRRLNI